MPFSEIHLLGGLATLGLLILVETNPAIAGTGCEERVKETSAFIPRFLSQEA